MRITVEGTTNKSYLMVNTLKVKLQSGSVLTLDRQRTEFTIGEPDETGKRSLEMDWIGCYLWAIDDENLFYNEVCIDEDVTRLFEGAKLIELELEDDADEDYEVSIESLSIDSASISV